jgi:hypothetical protein
MPALTCPGCWGQLFPDDPAAVVVCPRCGTRCPPPADPDARLAGPPPTSAEPPRKPTPMATEMTLGRWLVQVPEIV